MYTSDSSLDFRVTPTSVTPQVTNNLHFRCAVNKTTTSDHHISSIASISLSHTHDVIAVVDADNPTGSRVSHKYNDVTVIGDLTGGPEVKG